MDSVGKTQKNISETRGFCLRTTKEYKGKLINVVCKTQRNVREIGGSGL